MVRCISGPELDLHSLHTAHDCTREWRPLSGFRVASGEPRFGGPASIARRRPSNREAKDWSAAIEGQAHHIAASGYAPAPKGATLGDLIDKYGETNKKTPGRTKVATLAMLKRELGDVKLSTLNAVTLRGFIDKRVAAGAGGVTIAADLSFLSAVIKWARHSRRLDVPERLALEARESLSIGV